MTTTIPRPPQRADGRRNRERLVAAATRVFTEQGVDAPLDNIAKEAGVGNATLYRNFPSREALLEAVLHDVHATLGRQAERLLTVTPADAAFAEWLETYLDYTQSLLGLPEPIMASFRDPGSALVASCEAMQAVAARLLTRAQDAGELRSDAETLDILTHVLGIAWATQQAPDRRQQAGRLLSVLMRGLRA